ncbi:MAG: serine hydrolase [Synechococcales bacterium]|nr:serine hydrolase [Synechococcales bacterium]
MRWASEQFGVGHPSGRKSGAMKKSGGTFQFPFGQQRSPDRSRAEGRSSARGAEGKDRQTAGKGVDRRDRRRALKAELSRQKADQGKPDQGKSAQGKSAQGKLVQGKSAQSKSVQVNPTKATATQPNPFALRFGKGSSRRSNVGKPEASSASAHSSKAAKPNAQKKHAQRPNNVAQFPKQPASLEALQAKRSRRIQSEQSSFFAPPKNAIQLPQPRTRPGTALLYGTRLMILGIGLGVLGATMLSVWDPTKFTAGANGTQEQENVPADEKFTLKQGQENLPLKTQLQTLIAQNSGLSPAIFLLDLDTLSYVDINGTEAFPAASTIKFPILVAFFQDVDAGKVQLNSPLTMRKELIVGEAGDMQTQPVGTKFSALKTATEMMTKSDNTATNMIIDLLGGAEALNQRFQAWGLSQTVLRDWLPDVKGTNTTSAKDLATVMAQVNDGKIVSMRSRDRILEIMRRNEFNHMLPKGLGEGATIAHKTGTIGILVGDVGLVDTATGKRYLASVLVRRPRDDERAETLIQQVSKTAYQTFNQQTDAAVPAQPPAGRSRRTNIAQP